MELLYLLSKKEKKEFKSVLKNNKNKRLLLLLNNIDLTENNKDALFKVIFNKNRTPKNDYLLRNEIRLLKNEIKYFLACKQLKHITQQSEHMLDKLYIKELIRRKSGELIIYEAESITEKLLERRDIEKFCEIMPMLIKEKIYYYNPNSVLNKKILEQLESLSSAYEDLMHRKIMETEYIKAYIHKTNSQLNLPYRYRFPEKLLALKTDATSEYFKIKAISLSVKDTERLKMLHQMKELLTKINLPHDEIQKEKAALYTNIALEYSFNFKYLEAITYLNQSITLKKYLPEANFIRILYNYISLLIKAGKYNEALTSIELNYKYFKKNKSLLFRLNILKVVALIYNKEYKSAQREMPSDLKQGTFNDYIYLRSLLVIIYFETAKLDLAERETKNIMQTIRNNELIENHIEFCKIMQHLISLNYEWSSLSTHKQKDILKKIKSNLDYKKYARQNMLPMMWIHNNIDRIFALKN